MQKSKIIRNSIVTVVGFIIIYLVIYLLFIFEGPFPVGKGIQKSDWLNFTSAFLSLFGTLVISFVVYFQNRSFNQIENERIRRSQLPYAKIFKADDTQIKKEFRKDNKGYHVDCATLRKEGNTLKWFGREVNGGVTLFDQAKISYAAIYGIKNFGIGTAMKIKLKYNNEIYDFKNHLKVDDYILFRIDLDSLEKKTQSITLEFIFYDIYDNEYTQKLKSNFIINQTQFSFGISEKQFEPELKNRNANIV